MTGGGRSGMTWAGLQQRARLMAAIRDYLSAAGVLEVDTPLLRGTCASDPHIPETPVLGQGRAAYLQSSPEALLKCFLAEFGKPVFQLGRVYRAGEVGRLHQPEFTMLEWYRPGWSMVALMQEVGEVVRLAAPRLPDEFSTLDWTTCFQAGVGVSPTADASVLRARAASLGLSNDLLQSLDASGLRDLLFSHAVQPQLGAEAPIFLDGFLAADAAFSRLDPNRPDRARRFELYWRGVELANGGEELTEAVEWRRRAECDNKRRILAGRSSLPVDTDWEAALKQGMPPSSGVALGLDRLLMLAVDADRLQSVMPFAQPAESD